MSTLYMCIEKLKLCYIKIWILIQIKLLTKIFSFLIYFYSIFKKTTLDFSPLKTYAMQWTSSALHFTFSVRCSLSIMVSISFFLLLFPFYFFLSPFCENVHCPNWHPGCSLVFHMQICYVASGYSLSKINYLWSLVPN